MDFSLQPSGARRVYELHRKSTSCQFITLIYTNKIIAFNFAKLLLRLFIKKKIFYLNIIKYKEIIKYYLYKSNYLI